MVSICTYFKVDKNLVILNFSDTKRQYSLVYPQMPPVFEFFLKYV